MKNFFSIAKKFSTLETSKVVVLKLPYEHNVSYMGGCKKGPDAIVESSAFIELFDEQYKVKPHTIGIHTASAPVFTKNHEKNLEAISEEFTKYYKMGKFIVSLGGEHSVTIGLFNALNRLEKNFSILQFDAHTDLRSYFNSSRFSHACVMRRIYEENKSIYQVGIRSLCETENNFIKKEGLEPLFAWEMENMVDDDIIDKILKNTHENIYITFDVDFFDFSVIRSTGTPEPGGPRWFRTLNILESVFKQKNVLSMDVVELIGDEDSSISASCVALLIKKCITYKFFN